MEHQFWHQRWQEGRIGFHQAQINPLLQTHWPYIASHMASRSNRNTVFVPLCGKTLDMWWLRDQGFDVVGAELSLSACEAFFSEAGVTPTISKHGAHHCYQGAGVTLWGGDFFALRTQMLGPISAFFDRAALIALPPEMRADYVQYLHYLVANEAAAPGLLVTLEYPPEARQGPPFAIFADEVQALYQDYYQITALATQKISDTKGSDRAYSLITK